MSDLEALAAQFMEQNESLNGGGAQGTAMQLGSIGWISVCEEEV